MSVRDGETVAYVHRCRGASNPPLREVRKGNLAPLGRLVAVPAIVCLLLGMIGLRGEAARAKCGLILETKQDVQELRKERKGEKMNLRELVAKIVGSSREDWHLIADPPSGLNRLQFHGMYESQQNVLHTAAHPRVGT